MPDEERSKRLRAIAAILEALTVDAARLRDPEGIRQPLSGSIAAEENDTWRASHEGPSSRMITEALASGYRLLAAAEDRIGAVAEFAARPDRAFSALTLLRAAVEAVSLAYWLLDPSIGAEARAERAAHGVRNAAGSAKSFSNKSGIDFDAKDIEILEEQFKVAEDVGLESQPTWEALARDLATQLGLSQALSDSGFSVLVDAAHSGKNVRDTIVPAWSDEGDPLSLIHPITEWGLWFIGNLYSAAVLRAGELIGWPGLDEWEAAALARREALQELVDEARLAFEQDG